MKFNTILIILLGLALINTEYNVHRLSQNVGDVRSELKDTKVKIKMVPTYCFFRDYEKSDPICTRPGSFTIPEALQLIIDKEGYKYNEKTKSLTK